LKTDPERRFYHHRATNQTQWHPPEGWDPAQARQHQRSSRAASRKLLQAGGGEGRLCKPSPAGEPSPGMQDDVLGLVPCPDDTMICEPLDPMFCPNVPNVCDDWDCKCYGPGKNDNTTITGVLGRTVIDGEKSSLSCGCGTESESGMAKSITSMPFEWKKNSKGELVMDYQCCDDYFDGYQCTMWDYSQTGSPVCLSMYDDHNMKKCAAEKCCSSYTEDLTRPYPGPWDDAAAGTTGPGPNSCVSPMTGLSLANNGWCDETECPPLSLRNHDMYGGGDLVVGLVIIAAPMSATLARTPPTVRTHASIPMIFIVTSPIHACQAQTRPTVTRAVLDLVVDLVPPAELAEAVANSVTDRASSRVRFNR